MMDRVEPVHVDPRGHVISTLFSSLFINNGTNDRELVGKWSNQNIAERGH